MMKNNPLLFCENRIATVISLRVIMKKVPHGCSFPINIGARTRQLQESYLPCDRSFGILETENRKRERPTIMRILLMIM